jgi:hypothetical protein
MFASALPERVDGEPDNAGPRDDREHRARLGWCAGGGPSFIWSDLAEPPGERPDRRSEDRSANQVKPALAAAIFRREDEQNSHCYERERRVNPKHRWPGKGLRPRAHRPSAPCAGARAALPARARAGRVLHR